MNASLSLLQYTHVIEKCAQATAMTAALRRLSSKTDSEELHKEWSRYIKSHHAVKNIWAILKRKMSNTQSNITDDLKDVIKATWPSKTPQQFNRLIPSMACRIEPVICDEGFLRSYTILCCKIFLIIKYLEILDILFLFS